MTHAEYITRQLSRTHNKRFENYVITRIWHTLNDLSLKIVTQQYVTRPTGRALSDLYFPQLRMHVEVDEGHHGNGKQVLLDEIRERDIINATDHEIARIKVYDVTLESINQQTDELIASLRRRIESEKRDGRYAPWDIEADFNPETYIRMGYMDARDSVAFRTIYEACNCFGYNYAGFQRGFTPHGRESDCQLWFPSLYRHRKWDNSTSSDESEIYERPITPLVLDGDLIASVNDYFNWFPKNPKRLKRRIVFAYAKDNLGVQLYRFKGAYQFDEARTREVKTHTVYRRVETRVKTYPTPQKASTKARE